MKLSKTKVLAECAIMVALTTVLSFIKIIELPYGGSVTIAAMLPIAIIGYRHGPLFGMASGLCFSVIKMVLGLGNFSYVTGWVSVVALALFDYLIALAVVGLAGLFRGRIKNQAASLAAGTVFVSVLRYISYVISGATVWAGLPIPTGASIGYSLGYNATFMIPETIVIAIVALYIGANIDLCAATPARIRQKNIDAPMWISPVSWLILILAVVYDTVAVFSHLQNSETGEFALSQIKEVNFTAILIVTGIACVMAAVLFTLRAALAAKNKAKS